MGPHFVPADQDIAPLLVYYPHVPPPCPQCRRKSLDSGSQSCVYLTNRGEDVALFQCRACGHYQKVPIVRRR